MNVVDPLAAAAERMAKAMEEESQREATAGKNPEEQEKELRMEEEGEVEERGKERKRSREEEEDDTTIGTASASGRSSNSSDPTFWNELATFRPFGASTARNLEGGVTQVREMSESMRRIWGVTHEVFGRGIPTVDMHTLYLTSEEMVSLLIQCRTRAIPGQDNPTEPDIPGSFNANMIVNHHLCAGMER